MSNNTLANKVINNVTNGVKKAKSSSFIKIIIIVVAIIVVIGVSILIYFLINNSTTYNNNNPIILSGEKSADTSEQDKNAYIIPNLPTSINGYSNSFSVWIFINDFVNGSGKYKNILSRSQYDTDDLENNNAPKGRQCPGLFIDRKINKLIAYTSLLNGDDDNTVYNECVINNLPLNKWNHIVYVLNQNVVDLYLNGKLEKSCVLNGIPNSNPGDKLYLAKNNGFNGKIANVQFFTSAITPQKVLELYNKGETGTNTFSDDSNLLNINFAQLKNDICSGSTSNVSDILQNSMSNL